MASIVGLFEGGTTGLRDGTLISSADAETNAFPITALDTVHVLHYRTIDDSTGEDTGQDSTGNLAPSCPTGLVACFTEGGSYVAEPTTGATKVTGGNQPLYLKQTALSETEAVNLTIGALDWEVGARIGQVGTVTPYYADANVVLDWADVASADGYAVDRATNSDFTENLTHLTTSQATSTYTDTSTSDGTTYYYRVRAYDERGVGAWSTAALVYPYRAKIVLNTSNTGANTSGAVTNALVAVEVNSSSLSNATKRTAFFNTWNTSGGRVRFYDASGTVCKYKVGKYDNSGQAAVYYVVVPSVAGNNTTQALYLGYGADIYSSDQQQALGSPYAAVWPFGDAGYGTTPELKDVSGNGHDGTATYTGGYQVPADTTGKVARGREFFAGGAGTGGSYITVPDSADWTTGTSDFALAFWVKFGDQVTAQNGYSASILQHWDSEANRWCFKMDRDSGGNYLWNFVAGTSTMSFSTSPSTGTWYRVLFARVGNEFKCFVNGSQIGTTVTDTVSIADNDAVLRIGTYWNGGAYHFNLDGVLDEMQFIRGTYGADAVKIDYTAFRGTNFTGDAWMSWS